MNCPHCGTELPDNARFCANCGTRIEAIPQHPYIPGQQDTQGYGYPDSPVPPAWDASPQAQEQDYAQPPKRRPSGAVIAIIALVVVLVVGGIAGIVMFATGLRQPGSGSGAGSTHPVTFLISITDDYGSSSSRIPMRITGTQDDGTSVDKTFYLAYSGPDIELPNGSYHAEVVGSPITPNGVIYEVPSLAIDFTLGSDLRDGEQYQMPDDLALVFYPIDAADMTKSQVADAVEWARKDEQLRADADELEQAALERMQGAVGDAA